jgi:chromosome segregation ATPase
MPDRDKWRQDKANEYARWLMGNCVPCPVVECGAMVCGDEQKEQHLTWHESINDDRTTLRARQTEVEGTFTVTRAQVNATLATLNADRTALQNRLTLLEGKFTAANAQLADIATRLSSVETRVTNLGG